MKQIHQQYLKLNKNLLVSFFISAAISTLVAQILADQENYLNASYTIIAGYAAFFSVFGVLYYIDCKKRYSLVSGKTSKELLKKELIRLVSSLGIGEIVYIVIRWFLQYYLLSIAYEPYLASLTSEAIATIVYMLVVTLGVKMTGLFKDNNQISSSS